MNNGTRRRLLASAAVVGATLAASAIGARAETTLTFVWHAGTCADALMDIAKDYPDKSVKIVPALVPYGPQWHDKIASEFAIQATPSTSPCGTASRRPSSRSMREAQRHLQHLVLSQGRHLPAGLAVALRRISGRLGRVLRPAANQDAYGLTYRKDLFEDPKEKEAFKAKYGRDLAVPQTYQEAKEVAEFFTVPIRASTAGRRWAAATTNFATTASNSFLGPSAASSTIPPPSR